MTHVANDLIGRSKRQRLYESGESLDPNEIETGMFVIDRSLTIHQVVARSRAGEQLPRGHSYSMDYVDGGYRSGRWTDRDCVCLSMCGAPIGPERVARVYRDVTDAVYGLMANSKG